MLAAGIAGARLLEIAGAAHILPVECPEQITAEIGALLAR